MMSLQKKYSQLIARCKSADQSKFQILIIRLTQLTTSQIALYVADTIVHDSDVIHLYNGLEDDELEKQAGIVWSQSSGEDANTELKFKEKQIKDKARLMEKKKQQRTHEMRRQIQPAVQTPQDYIRYSISFLRKYKQFSSHITQGFLKQFLSFYRQYQELPLLSKREITQRARKIQGSRNNDFLVEINVTDSALYYASQNHRLRVTQVLALYCFLYKPEIQKVLLQILTGEGKSTTIACLAAILAMRGHNVDIITTNKILATRDVEEKRNFYKLMNLNVAHNISAEDNSRQSLEPRKCYEKGTIVYGTPFSYQVDLLYDEYKKRGTRNKRPYEIAIVDEVDSMFVDQKQNQTLLASTFSGFAELKDALKIIWQTIVTHNIAKQDGKLYLYRPGEKQGDIIKGQVKQCLNLIIEDIRTKFKNDVINVEKLEFIEISLDNWILSAISAAHEYKQGVHYIIDKNKVIPVDFRNTGCLQKNVEWENGLHQFLQMKHGLRVTVESMTSNFMSNIGHFCRYPRLYGLTGTLGSKKSMQFLQKIYKVSMSQIPPFHERRLAIIPGFVMYDHKGWINRICQRCQKMVEQGRAVLLICQSIQQADLIQQEILLRGIRAKQIIQMKTGEENNSDRIVSGSIIIATNVAGRGTDLKASDFLVRKGGLHVIITFVPENQRVEMQARGRAGRNGAPGSSQIIMNLTQYFNAVGIGQMSYNNYKSGNVQNNIPLILAQVRDQRQFQLMESDYERVENLRTRDKIFEIFCKATSQIPDYQTNKGKRDAIQEEWAMFLKRSEHLKLSNQDKLNGAQQFALQMSQNSDKFYKKSHGIGRGINEFNKGNYNQARKFFKQSQIDECTKNIQIGGSILEGATIIKADGKSQKQIQLGIKAMCGALPIIHERKEMIKGLSMRDLTTENRDIARLLEQTQIREIPRNSFRNFEQDGNNDRRQQVEQLKISERIHNPADLAQIRVLQAIQNHIMKQMEKAGNINLEKQQLDIRFDPITSLKDLAEGKQEELREAFEDLVPDIPTIPTIEVKKKKVPWWKRVLVFALGVLQICIGALIVASTAGAAAGFGAFMIQSGITDCINALFRPEVINDLKSYYSSKALEYGMAAVLAGTAGLKQIYNAGSKGFTLIKNTSMSEVMKIAATKIGQGLSKGGFDIRGLIQHHLFKGISDRFTNQKDKIKVQQITKIVKNPVFKDIVNNGEADEEKMEAIGKQIQKRFELDSEKIIKNLVENSFDQFMGIIRQFKVCKEHIFILINNSFVQTFKQKFNEGNRNQLYTQMRDFMKDNYQSKTLAEDVIKIFDIDELILKSIQNIAQDQNYQKVIHNANIDLHNKILEEINKTNTKYKAQTDNQYTELNNIKNQIENNNSITVAEFNRRKAEFDQKLAAYNVKLTKRNQFIDQVKQISGDGTSRNNLAQTFMNSGLISEGKINLQELPYSDIHPYIKEALGNLQNFTTCDKDFKNQIQIRAYNSFIGIAVKALNQVIDYSSKSASRLRSLQNKLYSAIQKK